MVSSFEVLAEPNRRHILDLTQPSISKHLKVLRDTGMVEATAVGQRRGYRVTPGPLIEIDRWLEPYRACWRRSLDRLEQHLDTMPDDAEEERRG
jgi:DNA-binding transcriptional ArsR family regulator